MPDKVIAGPVDAICIGEGEYPVLELCRQLEGSESPHGIPNLWIKSNDGAVEKNPPRSFIANLESLPFPDREMWKPWLSEQLDDEMTILGGRGCPYKCTYCSNHALSRVAPGKYVRMRSPVNILEEVKFLYDNFSQQRSISFEVETIASNKKWAIELCEQLAKFVATVPEPVSFGTNYRIAHDSLDETLFESMKKANFNVISIGLESGSERVRREILGRNYSNDDFLKAVSLARKYGLQIYVYNMIGLPTETKDDHEKTILLNRLCQPEGHHTGIFYPYAGTEIYDVCVKLGLISQSLPQLMERRQSALDLPNFSRSQIQSAYTWFNYHVYKGKKSIFKVLAMVMIVKINSNPLSMSLFRKIAQLPLIGFLRKRLGL